MIMLNENRLFVLARFSCEQNVVKLCLGKRNHKFIFNALRSKYAADLLIIYNRPNP